MIEIFVGLIFMVILSRLFRARLFRDKKDDSIPKDTILPFVENGRYDDETWQDEDFYDWEDNFVDDIDSIDDGCLDDIGDE